MIVSKLNNGIRTIVKPLTGLKSVSVEVMIKMGAKYEDKDEQGMSHFLEHMAFKGTKKRPSMIDIAREIEGKGAEYNAETGLETVGFNITTIRENLEWSLELLADILINPVYKEEEIAKEIGVISEEIRMYQDNPIMGLREEYVKYLYGGSNRGCWDVAGDVKDIKKITREKVLKYKDKYFNPNRMVIAISGDIEAGQQINSLVEEHFGGFLNKKSEDLPEVKIMLTKESKRTDTRDIQQAHFCLGVPTFGRRDPRRYALRLMDILMSGNTSSRLFNKIRLEKGWAYYVSSVGQGLEETGFWAVQSGVKQEKLGEAIETTLKEMEIFSGTVTGSELDSTKNYLIGRLKLEMDKSEFWSDYLAEKLLLEDKLVDIESELEKFRQTKLGEVKGVAFEVLKGDRVRLLVFSQADKKRHNIL